MYLSHCTCSRNVPICNVPCARNALRFPVCVGDGIVGLHPERFGGAGFLSVDCSKNGCGWKGRGDARRIGGDAGVAHWRKLPAGVEEVEDSGAQVSSNVPKFVNVDAPANVSADAQHLKAPSRFAFDGVEIDVLSCKMWRELAWTIARSEVIRRYVSTPRCDSMCMELRSGESPWKGTMVDLFTVTLCIAPPRKARRGKRGMCLWQSCAAHWIQ